LAANIKYVGQPVEEKIVKQLDGRFSGWTKKMPPIESIHIKGEFQVKKTGFYQIVISTKGMVSVEIDNILYSKAAPEKKYGLVYIPISLGQGWHSISIKPSQKGMDKLTLLLSGDQEPTLLGGEMVRNNTLQEE